MERFFQIIILCFLASYAGAFNSCDDPDLIQEYEELKSKRDASYGRETYEIADSLIQLMLESGLENCKLLFKIRLIKGEAIELGFEFERVLEYYYELISDAGKQGYDDITAETLICLARVHERIDRPLSCKRNLLNAKALIQENGMNHLYSQFAVRFASYHRIFESKDSAAYYANQAIVFGKKYDDKRSVVDGHLLLGIVTENFDSKIYHFRRARDLFLNQRAYIGAASQSLNISKILFEVNQPRKALSELDSSLYYIKKHPFQNKDYFYIFYKIYNQKQNYFVKQNQLDSALYYSELGKNYQIKSIQYRDQEKVNEIETLNAIQIERNKADAKDRELYLLKWILIFGAFISLFLILLSAINIRNKKKLDKQNKYINSLNIKLKESLRDKTILLSEIHHRVNNILQMIISLLFLEAQKSSDQLVKEKFTDISDKIYSIALIHEQLYKKGNFDKINVESYFKDLVSHFQNISNLSGDKLVKLNLKNVYLNLETVIPIGIIIAELLSNSFKSGVINDQALGIDVNMHESTNIYTLIFKDKGPGFPDGSLKQSTDSMGALLIYSMAKQLNAKCKSYNDNGAVFEMIFTEKMQSGI